MDPNTELQILGAEATEAEADAWCDAYWQEWEDYHASWHSFGPDFEDIPWEW